MFQANQPVIFSESLAKRLKSQETKALFVKYIDEPVSFPTVILDCVINVDGVLYYACSEKITAVTQKAA